MERTHLLDTSVFSQRLRPQPHAASLARWDALGDSALVTSVICDAEVLFGIAKKQSDRLARLYREKLRLRLPFLPVDASVAEAYAQLRAQGESAGVTVAPLDLLIAATAKAHGLIVATLNAKHFSQINGLPVEDWSQP